MSPRGPRASSRRRTGSFFLDSSEMPTHHVLFVGIAGGSASGKTTLATRLCEHLGDRVCRISMDCYYRAVPSSAERNRANFDHPEALDWPLLEEQIRQLMDGKAILRPTYSFELHARLPSTDRVEPRPLLLLDGLHALHHRGLREMMDLRVFVDAPPDIRLQRRIERDVAERGRTAESVREQWATTVLPMHEQFVEPVKAEASMVIVVPTLESVDIVAEVIEAWIWTRL